MNEPPTAKAEPFVLLAAPLTSKPSMALQRAESISRALTRSLVVLRVPIRERSRAEGVDDGTPSRGTCNYSLAMRARGQHLLIRCGDFLSVVAETARSLKPALVVIPDMSGQTGRWVQDLALESRVPILLAREMSESNTIVAASDLSNPRFPVLRAGAFLLLSLQARLMFIHNVAPSEVPTVEGQAGNATGARLVELALAARSLHIESENVVTTRPSAAEAILSILKRERADIAVVGVRERSRRPPGVARLAETIIDQAPRSVLAVPVDASLDALSWYGNSGPPS